MADPTNSRIRRPVKREGAERYLRNTLTSFAASVIVTRLYLMATGYPQIGSGNLHIAHVLWGGLLLFVAALLPLLLSNRWAYTASSVIAGIGVGLFIDEVGKFLTKNVDYFFAPAAPIIYGFFLFCVFVYVEIRRPSSTDPRGELYRALDALADVLDHNLTAHERTQLDERLAHATAATERPDLKRLGAAMLTFVRSDVVAVVEFQPGPWQRSVLRLEALESRLFVRSRHRLLLGIGLLLLGVLAALNLGVLLVEAFAPAAAPHDTRLLTLTGGLAGAGGSFWFVVHLLLRGLVTLLLLAGLILFLLRDERLGLRLAIYGLLLSLTTVNLYVFYFDQFNAVAETLMQFIVLLSAIRYRRRYLANPGVP